MSALVDDNNGLIYLEDAGGLTNAADSDSVPLFDLIAGCLFLTRFVLRNIRLCPPPPAVVELDDEPGVDVMAILE
jgi:hypothetical protein